MSILPASGYISDGGRTEGEQKQAFEDLRGVVSELPGGSAETELTISAGTVTPTGATHRIDTEADAATDLLDHIAYTNHPDGRWLLIHAENSGRVVTVVHGAGGDGQILLSGAANFALGVDAYLLLRRSGTTWVEVYRFVQSGIFLLESQTVSNVATVDFTGITSAFETYIITINNLVPVTDASQLLLRMGTGAGPSWDASAIYDVAGVAVGTSSALAGVTGLNQTSIGLATACGTGTGEKVDATINIYSPAGALYKSIASVVTQYSSAPEAIYRAENGLYKSTTAVTGFRILMSAGNISSAVLTLQGVRK